MQLNSFRDLLEKKIIDLNLRKTLDNTTDSILVDYVVEILEKMASHDQKSAKENVSLSHFVSQMDPDTDHAEAHFIRDAMGHHASHYKAALKAGNQDLANKHAHQFIKLGHLVDKISRIDPTKMKFESAELQPWQANRPDLFVDPDRSSGVDLRNWQCHFKMKGGKNKDFSWLQNAPHESRGGEIFKKPYKKLNENGEIENHFHTGGFPMEHVRINGKYIPIEENVDVSHGHWDPHPFDTHPIMNVFWHSAKDHMPKASDYQASLSRFHEGDEYDNLIHKLPDLMSPEHGSQPGDPVHEPVANPSQRPVGSRSLSQDQAIQAHHEKSTQELFDSMAELGIDGDLESNTNPNGLVIRRRQE